MAVVGLGRLVSVREATAEFGVIVLRTGEHADFDCDDLWVLAVAAGAIVAITTRQSWQCRSVGAFPHTLTIHEAGAHADGRSVSWIDG